jgi:hypothetical protein
VHVACSRLIFLKMSCALNFDILLLLKGQETGRKGKVSQTSLSCEGSSIIYWRGGAYFV